MKKYNILFCVLLIVLPTIVFGQLKVDQFGRIGMGTNWPNPGYRLHVKGNVLLTTHPDRPFHELQMKVGNGWPGAEIGSSSGNLAFWSSGRGYINIYSRKHYRRSDRKLKREINPISNAMKMIKNLNGYSYYPIDSEEEKEKLEYGFIAQDVEEIFPDLVEDAKDTKVMDYDQIIPILVEAIKEQQKEIDALKAKLGSKK